MLRRATDVRMSPIELDGANAVEMAVLVGRADGAPHFAMRRFRVAPGGNTPQHRHNYEHEVFIVGGSGSVLLKGERLPIGPGDSLYVAADEEHGFFADRDQPLEFLCLVPADRNCGGPTPGS